MKLFACLCIVLLLLPAFSVHFAYGTTYDWSMPRPSTDRDFNQTLVAASSDGRAGVGVSTTVAGYTENTDDWGYPVLDYLALRIALSAETREGITYGEYSDSYSWHSVSRPTNITADNTGVLLNISDCAPYLGPILFFGVAYTSVWVCDNGFISFDSTQNDSSPCSIPDSAFRHSIVAPLWRNLIPDTSSSITYDEVVIMSEWALVISWNNIRDATGNRQTFQVVIWNQYSYPPHDSHQYIIFNYNTVTSYQDTTIGVQNQAGSRGTSISLSHAYNSNAVKLWSLDSANYQLTKLTIKLDKSSDSTADIVFQPPSNQTCLIEGYNIDKENSENPYGSLWIIPFDYLAGAFLAGIENPAAGLICGMLLTTFDTGVAVTDALYNADVYGPYPALTSQPTATVNATTAMGLTMLPFDADMAVVVFVRFYDSNTDTHTVTITGQADYQCVGDPGLTYTADTSMTLNMFTGQHYLDLSTILENEGGPTTGASVTFDGQSYSSPFSLSNVSDGYHQIAVESSIFRNGLGYHFHMWTPGDSYSNPYTVNFNQDYNLSAHYEPIMYDLTINTTYGGNTLPRPGVHPYQSGDTAGAYATSNVTGYYFKRWLLNGSFYSSYYGVNVYMNNNYLLEAQFDNHYNLTVSSTLWGTTSPYPDVHTYTYGTTLNVTALPWTGCVFDYWTLDGTNYTSPNPIAINMTANHSIMAHFHDASGGGGEGRCPTLFSWNGTDYAHYGIIPLHNASGFDVLKEMPVNASDVGINHYLAQFRLREGWLGLNSSESVIDQVKLYAIDACGHCLFCPLVNATHSSLGNVLRQLLFSDDWRVQMTLLEMIDLSFLMPYPSFVVKSYVFVIEGCNQFKQ